MMIQMPTADLNHVSLLVASARVTAGKLSAQGYAVGTAKEWAEGGTLEIYVGGDAARGALLLQEPVAEGAYARAMNKRGPGLHHIALDVARLDPYLEGLAQAGWLLHPISRKTIAKTRTAWLSSPGVPGLIEIQERASVPAPIEPPFITQVRLPAPPENPGLIEVLGAKEIVPSDNLGISIRIGPRRLSIADLLRA